MVRGRKEIRVDTSRLKERGEGEGDRPNMEKDYRI